MKKFKKKKQKHFLFVTKNLKNFIFSLRRYTSSFKASLISENEKKSTWKISSQIRKHFFSFLSSHHYIHRLIATNFFYFRYRSTKSKEIFTFFFVESWDNISMKMLCKIEIFVTFNDLNKIPWYWVKWQDLNLWISSLKFVFNIKFIF